MTRAGARDDLQTSFDRYFDIVNADQPHLVDEALSLRYQVYCLETSYEVAARFTDARETDRYDRRAVHSLIRHRATGAVAATVRLVLADPADDGAPFPIESHCAASFAAAGLEPASLPRLATAEISRFAVSKEFKRRVGEAGTLAGVGPDLAIYQDGVQDGARLFPHVTLGLFAAIVRMSAVHGISHWYAVMEPSLLRLLTRYGIAFRRIGGLVDYHGERQPCWAPIDAVLAGIAAKRPDVWRFITANGALCAERGSRSGVSTAARKQGAA